MTTTRPVSTTPLHTTLSQQALSLGLAAVLTAGVLAGLLGLAGGDQAAVLAQQMQPMKHAPQAITTVLAPLLA